MKNIFSKSRLKIILVLGTILLGFFAAPKIADAVAVKSASYARTQIEKIMGETAGGRLLAVGDTDVTSCPPGEKWDAKLAICISETQKAAGTTGAKATTTTDDVAMIIAGVLSLILNVIARIIWPIVFLTGALMENDIIFSGAMGIKLHDMWIQMRNIVNLLFVVVLVGVAIYNLTGFASEKFQIKQILPKIILGLVLVNFSYMIATVALDAISVGTNAMFGLPVTVGVNSTITKDVEKDICDATGYKITGATGSKTEKALGKQGEALTEELNKQLCVNGEPAPGLDSFVGSWRPHSAAVIMAVELMNMQNLQKAVLGKDLNISGLTINIIFAIVMFLVYGISSIVLFIILLGRAIVVWLAVVLSPFLMVTYIMPDITQKAGADELKKVSDQVIATAIAPMIIGFVLSVGYILMKTLQGAGKVLIGSDVGNTLAQNMLSFKTNVSGIADFQQLMIAIGTVGFVWAGVKAASSKAITTKATETVMGMAQKGGAWLAKAPFYYSNIFPTGTGKPDEKVSLGTMLKTFTGIPKYFEDESQKDANKVLDKLGLLSSSAAITSNTLYKTVKEADPKSKEFANDMVKVWSGIGEKFNTDVQNAAKELKLKLPQALTEQKTTLA
ncbi:hypothetical protein HZA39_04555, partial [Candidatus Peregrinibacteria bacterium]|nr:hypothetical protein [Candidatus Peregrinibacteria bacterium]